MEDSATSSFDQPLRWKARWHRDFAGVEVYDMRARQWVPELGAFLSIDEYVFHDRKSTLWGWPGQNPIRYRDPSGRVGPDIDGDNIDHDPDWNRGVEKAGTIAGTATVGGLAPEIPALAGLARALALASFVLAATQVKSSDDAAGLFALAATLPALKSLPTPAPLPVGAGTGAGMCVASHDPAVGPPRFGPPSKVPHVATDLPNGNVFDPTLRGNLESYGKYVGDIPNGQTEFDPWSWERFMNRMPDNEASRTVPLPPGDRGTSTF